MEYNEILYLILFLIFTLAALFVADHLIWRLKVKRFVTGGNFTMHYQPIILEGNVVALEALICLPAELTHDGLSKEDVIRYIEKTSLSHSFTLGVFRMVLNDYIHHFRENPGVIISINVPPQDICNERMVEFFLCFQQDAEIPANTFMLEVTERNRITSRALFMKNLNRLRDGGFLLAIDDAGKGLSQDIIALRFPFDYVKTEITVLKNESVKLSGDYLQVAIQDACAGVIVEHIETAQDAELAQTICHRPLLQGWYYSRAIPAWKAAENFKR